MICLNSIKVYPESVSLKEGDWYYDAYVEACPTNATCKSVIWSSSNTNVATVNATSGYIYAKSAGTATIYARAKDGSGKVGTCTVTVDSLISVESVTVNPTAITMDIGETETCVATVTPANATNQSVKWSSSDRSVATVGIRSGKVEAKSSGVTVISATTDSGGYQAHCQVTVKEPTVYYNIVNKQTGKVANINGSYLVNLSNEKNITLYSKSGSNEQVWKIDTISDSETCYIRSYVDQDYGFNAYRYPSSNYNCNIYKISGNETDAAVHFVLQEDGSYKIKLANYSNYYLTATGSNDGSDIRWQPEDATKNQCWKLEIVDFSERESMATAVISKIQSCSTTLIPSDKKTASVAVAQAMLGLGYPISFVAGMIANIVYEGSTGQFESSNYVSDPNNKPDYLVYMDTEYNGTNHYLNNFSGKTVMDVGVNATYNMLCELAERSNNTWYVNGSRVGFGLGCIQWSFARTLNLVNAYREINNDSNTITTEQACRGEALLILRELGSSEYNSIISSWESAATSLNSRSAASSAGRDLCNQYICPSDDTGSVATTRANLAASIYSAIAI